jgi:hypothetical protein
MSGLTDVPLSRRCVVALLSTVVSIAGCTIPAGAQERPRDSARFTLKQGDLWISDVTVISSERGTPLPHAHIVTRGVHILYVGSTPPRGRTSGVTVLKATGQYLVPGLIDGHVHLAEVPGVSPLTPAALSEAYFQQMPRSYVYFGFTTVVDLNVADRATVEHVRKADTGPAVFDCGGGLALANGYPMNYLPADVRFERYTNFLYDARQADSIPQKYSPEEHSPEAAVQRVVDGGGICVKSYYEPGFDPTAGKLPVPTEDMMRRVRDASHPRVPVLLHANSLEAHRFAVSAGVDAVAHGLWNWGTPNTGGNAEPPEPVREVLDAERRAGIAYMPTMRVLAGLGGLLDPTFLDDAHLKKVLPAKLIAWYRTTDGQWFAKEIRSNLGGVPAERIPELYANLTEPQRALSYVVSHGGRVLFGTDTPSAPTYANPRFPHCRSRRGQRLQQYVQRRGSTSDRQCRQKWDVCGDLRDSLY